MPHLDRPVIQKLCFNNLTNNYIEWVKQPLNIIVEQEEKFRIYQYDLSQKIKVKGVRLRQYNECTRRKEKNSQFWMDQKVFLRMLDGTPMWMRSLLIKKSSKTTGLTYDLKLNILIIKRCNWNNIKTFIKVIPWASFDFVWLNPLPKY